jgi:hypothetical protein
MDDEVSRENIDSNFWYQVLIGFSMKPEIRSGRCIKSLINFSRGHVQIMSCLGKISIPDEDYKNED